MIDLKFTILASLFAFSGCSVSTPPEVPVDDDSAISCAIGSATEFTRNCWVERETVEGTLFLTIHHDNGGFQRFEVMTDGSGITTADGADMAAITVFAGEIEVSVGEDRYLLPATITGGSGDSDDTGVE